MKFLASDHCPEVTLRSLEHDLRHSNDSHYFSAHLYLKEKKIPVRIIVCGVEDSFNTKYLEIAYATGGTIHTMEDDLKNLASMKDGTTFKIGKIKYKVAKGKFYQVR